MTLAAQNITKRFSGVTALEDVSLELPAGKVTSIIGENGAGKSTLMKVLSGVHTDYEGTLRLDGQDVRFKNTRQAQDAGIAIIHQELNLLPYLSIAENIFLGREPRTSFGTLDKRFMGRSTQDILGRVGLNRHPDTKVGDLKVGEQQMVEIAKALLLDAKVIIMDEPTSAITDSEAKILFQIIGQLKKDGKAIAYISHKMNEIFAISDRYTVLRDGKFIGAGTITEVDADQLIHMMAGREIALHEHNHRPGMENQERLLEVVNVRLPGFAQGAGISFSLHKGEILGVFGLMGAGRTELLETLFGLHPGTFSGKIIIENTPMKFKSPKDAIRSGLALVSEDRKRDGIVPDLSVRKNIGLTTLGQMAIRGVLPKQREKALAQKYIDDLNIKTATDRQLIKNLSGGNQQKAILAKWLATNPSILMLDEPTRGIDVHAKSEIHRRIGTLAAEGMGILMVSSELPEILAVSHRVLVLGQGRVTGTFDQGEATESNILKAAIA